MNELLEPLYRVDLWLLYQLNVAWSHPYLDVFWSVISRLHKNFWFLVLGLPLLLGWGSYIYRVGLIKVILAVAMAVAIADSLAYRVIKSRVDRPRPFQNLELEWVRQVGEAHGRSFPSNHTANCFATASVLVWFFRSKRVLLYNIAGLIGISRVALGVHYPSDVYSGMILGLFVGFILRVFVLNRFQWFQLTKPVSTSDQGFRERRSFI